jgi:SAM-dependent methyltransferase
MSNIAGQISKQIKQIISAYNKSSNWCKVLIFCILLIILIVLFKDVKSLRKEGFVQNDKFLVKSGLDVYDDFYADIYDYLVFSNVKDDYEIGEIINKTTPSSQSKILDIGCGTGHHVDMLSSQGLDVIGIDISSAMIKKAKTNYPSRNFEVADARDAEIFMSGSFTHIMSLYFTIYYIEDKRQFLQNCYNWLMPGGSLILHLVDREMFDPILPSGNPLLLVSPQKYAEKRITNTTVKFNDFAYNADFELDDKNNIAHFVEKFKNNENGKVRKNEHKMYMPDAQEIVDDAQQIGFILESKVDLLQCQYEYQYLYIFRKPN